MSLTSKNDMINLLIGMYKEGFFSQKASGNVNYYKFLFLVNNQIMSVSLENTYFPINRLPSMESFPYK